MIRSRMQGKKLISKPIGDSHAQELRARHSRTDQSIVCQGQKNILNVNQSLGIFNLKDSIIV